MRRDNKPIIDPITAVNHRRKQTGKQKPAIVDSLVYLSSASAVLREPDVLLRL